MDIQKKSSNFAQNFKDMRYSRNKLNTIGTYLYAEGIDAFKRAEAQRIVSDWRETHLPVLREFVEELTNYFAKAGISYAFYSQRLKRMTSIKEKLQNNASKGMKLGGLQDIGGARFVFEDISDLYKAQVALKSFEPANFEREKINDYIAEPTKDSGYRSAHYIYKYHSQEQDYDGLRIELQIRTRLQHGWAMAVETASLISRTSLKADLDDKSVWREFFKLVSAIFAQKEKCPVNVKFADYSHEDYCREYISYVEGENKLLDKLKALQVTVNGDENLVKYTEGYCVLLIDFEKKLVSYLLYKIDEENEAAKQFTITEQSLNENEAVILVSIEKMKELREAYPSYFLDTKEFMLALKEFNESCAIYRKKE